MRSVVLHIPFSKSIGLHLNNHLVDGHWLLLGFIKHLLVKRAKPL